MFGTALFKPLICVLLAGGVIGGAVAATQNPSENTEIALAKYPDPIQQIEEEDDWTGVPNLENECTALRKTADISKPRYYLCLGGEKEKGQPNIRKPRLFYSWSDPRTPSKPVVAEGLYKVISISWDSTKSTQERLKMEMVNIGFSYTSTDVEWPEFLDKLQAPKKSVDPLKPGSQCSLTLDDSDERKTNKYKFSCEGTSWKIAKNFEKIEINGVKGGLNS